MFTVAGTATTEGRLLDIATFIPPAGAAVERTIKNLVVSPPVNGGGGPARKVVMVGRFPAGGVSVRDVAWDEPLEVAVSVTGTVEVTAEVVAVNVPVALPAA